MEFEEKVDIEDLVLPSKPTGILGIKKRTLGTKQKYPDNSWMQKIRRINKGSWKSKVI